MVSKMTAKELVGLIGHHEGKTLEFKRDLSSLEPVLKTLVAFANTAGGAIIIGRTNDGRVCGVKDVAKEEERLANVVAEGICPALLPDIEIVGATNKPLIVVRVARWPGPFYVRQLGPEQGVYLRLGSTNRRATKHQIAEIRRASEHLAFDQSPCLGAEPSDLDMEFMKRTFSSAGRDIVDAKLESLGVLTRYGHRLIPSNGGIILFGTNTARNRYFPDAQIRCARFAGTDKVEFLDSLTIEGSVLCALDEVARFVRRNTRMAARIESLRREDIPEYPAVALREAMVNAVAHTDYSERGMQIMVAIYSDRLEIQNPGTLPFGMTIDDLKAGISRIRNPVIVRVFRALDFMEEWGSGYKRITDACKEGSYKYPEWVELGSVVRVVFPLSPKMHDDNVPASVPVNVPVNKRQEWLLQQLRKGRRVSANEASRHFSVSNRTAKRDITKLRNAGAIEFVGPPKTGHYRLCSTKR